jgi:hypothetical protein
MRNLLAGVISVVLDQVVDLTESTQQRIIRTNQSELTGNWVNYAGVSPTQQLGEALYHLPGLVGSSCQYRTRPAFRPPCQYRTRVPLSVPPVPLSVPLHATLKDEWENMMRQVMSNTRHYAASGQRSWGGLTSLMETYGFGPFDWDAVKEDDPE